MKPYPSYKDSGVEWFEELPSHWRISKLSHAIPRISSGTTPPSAAPQYYSNGNVPWINTGDLNDGVLTSCKKFVTELALEDHSALKIYQSGSVIMAMYGATIGKLSLLEFSACTNQACCVIEKSDINDVKYIFYWLLSFRNRIIAMASGGGQPNINQDIITNLRVTLPPVLEQNAIAAFLDRETGKIDELVEEQRRLIALLREKRQSVVTHAVTKGLNPAVPKRASGVRWLGDVPKHWEIIPLKYLASIQSGGTPRKDNKDYWGGDIPWVSARDLKTEVVSDSTFHITDQALDSGNASCIEGGSVLVLVRGMTLSKAFPVCIASRPVAINQDLKALNGVGQVDNLFLAWALRGLADECLARVDEAGHGTKALRMDAWTSLSIALPPKPEQLSIVSFVERETSRIDSLCAEVEKGIALLQERRTALVSAAVTGKIDVRTASAQATEAA